MSNLTCAKLCSLYFLGNAIWQAVMLKPLGFVGSMIISAVFCAATLIIEEVKKQ